MRVKLIFQSLTVAPLRDSNGVDKRVWMMLIRKGVALGHSRLLPNKFPILGRTEGPRSKEVCSDDT